MTTVVLFYLFAVVLVVAGLATISAKNPVHAALFLMLSFFSGACEWMLMKAEFLAVALVLIYVGAVMVLFLFVVMMLDVNFEELRKGFWKHVPLAVVVALLMAVEMVLILKNSQIPLAGLPEPAAGYNNAHALGNLIYTQYFLPFQLSAALLLVGMISAIALTIRKRKNTKYINPADQIAVKREDRVRIVKMNVEPRPTVGEVAAAEDQPKA